MGGHLSAPANRPPVWVPKGRAVRWSLSAPKGTRGGGEPFGAKRLHLVVQPFGILPTCVCRQARSNPFFFCFFKKNWKQNLYQFYHDFNNFFLILHSLSTIVDPTLSSCKPTSKCLKIANPKNTFTQIQEMQNLTYLFALLVLLRHRLHCSLYLGRHVHFTLPHSSKSPPPLQLRSNANENDL